MKKLVLFSLLLVATAVATVSCKKADACYTCRYLGAQVDEVCRVDYATDADYEDAKAAIKLTFPFYTCN